MNRKSYLMILGLVVGLQSVAQDKVITLSGDTLNVVIPGDPWGELKIHYSNLGQSLDYGFKRIAVIYKKDSVRIHSAGQIKAFWRQKPGKHLGSGYFESASILENQLEINTDKQDAFRGYTLKVFRQQIFSGQKIKVWYYRKHSSSHFATDFYFIETNNAAQKVTVTRYSDWSQWASQHPPFDVINNQLRKPKNNAEALFTFFAKMAALYEKETP